VVAAEPFVPTGFDVQVWGLLLVGIALVIGIEAYASRRPKPAVPTPAADVRAVAANSRKV
jgi:hypothetical protein